MVRPSNNKATPPTIVNTAAARNPERVIELPYPAKGKVPSLKSGLARKQRVPGRIGISRWLTAGSYIVSRRYITEEVVRPLNRRAGRALRREKHEDLTTIKAYACERSHGTVSSRPLGSSAACSAMTHFNHERSKQCTSRSLLQ